MSEQIKRWDRKEHVKQRILFLANRLFRCSQYLLEWIPYKENRICCVTLTRKGYTDNMMYITQQLLKKCPDLEIVWVTKYPQTCDSAVRNGVRVVAYHTIRHFRMQFTSRIVMADDSLYHGLIKRKRQIYLNVWHGGINYKRLGKEGLYFEDAFMRKLFELRNPSPDYMAAGSRFFVENMRAAFSFDKTIFLRCGLPRNDVLFHSTSLEGKVKKYYHIEERKVILYAPTFREREDDSIVNGIDFERLLKTAQKRYGGEWTALYRAHYFVQNTEIGNENVIDVSDYENMQEILLDTDILISDYSSCMWDFSFLYRPIVVYAPDEEAYCVRERGFTAAGKTMPYPKTKNMKELIAVVDRHDFAADAEKIREHHKKMGAYDTGNATEYITNFIISKMNGEHK